MVKGVSSIAPAVGTEAAETVFDLLSELALGCLLR